MLPATGGIVSTTLTVVEQETVLLKVSATAISMRFVPSGNSAMKETFAVVGGLPGGHYVGLNHDAIHSPYDIRPPGKEATGNVPRGQNKVFT